MSTITTEIRNLRLKERPLIAKLETINANKDEFEIELLNPFAEGAIVDENVLVSVTVDVFGYKLLDRDQEVLIECELDAKTRPEIIESEEFVYEVAKHGSLWSDPLPELTNEETMLSLGDDLKIRLTLMYK